MVTVSVIITTHNRQDLLPVAIESALGQEPCDAQLEVIVVDDDSTDDTPGVVARYAGVRYIRTKQGTGAGSRNVGMARAGGEWIALLDDDDAWLPNKMARCCEEMRTHPGARMICSAAYMCDAEMKRGPVWACPDLAHARSPLEAFLVDMPATPSVMLHREVLEAVGPFDATIARAEDRDMWYRVLGAGYECAAIDEPLVLIRNRPQRDGELVLKSCRDTLAVIARYTAMPGATHLPWARRRRLCQRVRGWYTHELMEAASEARQRGDRAQARRYSRVALSISAVHWLRYHARGRH